MWVHPGADLEFVTSVADRPPSTASGWKPRFRWRTQREVSIWFMSQTQPRPPHPQKRSTAEPGSRSTFDARPASDRRGSTRPPCGRQRPGAPTFLSGPSRDRLVHTRSPSDASPTPSGGGEWNSARVAGSPQPTSSTTHEATFHDSGPDAPGSGPVFGLAAVVSLFLVSPAVRVGKPGLEGQRYWRRLWRILRYDDGRESRP